MFTFRWLKLCQHVDQMVFQIKILLELYQFLNNKSNSEDTVYYLELKKLWWYNN